MSFSSTKYVDPNAFKINPRFSLVEKNYFRRTIYAVHLSPICPGILGIVRIMHSLFLKYFLKLRVSIPAKIEIIAILNASLFLKSSKFSSLSCCGINAKIYFV